jgi:hypothetical protein
LTTTAGSPAEAPDQSGVSAAPGSGYRQAEPVPAPRSGPRHAARRLITILDPDRSEGEVRGALPAVAAYVAVRLVGLLALAVFGQKLGRSFGSLLMEWDAAGYVGVAERGYDTSITYVGDQLVNTNIAFFPLFPALIRVVSAVGISPWWSGVIIASLAGLAAACGIAMVGARLYSRRVGLLLAVLWGALPHAVVENMVYTESLFTALCAWALWAVLDRRWILAGTLTTLAGLTRPTAVALIAAVGVACVVAIVKQGAQWRDGGWRPWAGAVIAPAGYVGYLVWCAVALGRPDAYFWMQSRGWDTYIDFGYTTVHELGITATHASPLAMYVTSAILVLAVVLFVLLFVDRSAALALLIFAGLLLLTVLVQGGNYYYAKARFLLPAFPLLIPIATGLAAARDHVRYVVLGLLIAVSAWYGAYLTLTWHLSP